MPTFNPRINVTLSRSLDDLVRRWSVHQRCSKSQVLRELLETVEPSLLRAVALMDAASSAGPEALASLALSMKRSQDAAEDLLAGASMRIDRAHGDLVSQAEAVRGRRPQRAALRHGVAVGGVSNPPSSNRGVKSVRTADKAATTPSKNLGRQGRNS